MDLPEITNRSAVCGCGRSYTQTFGFGRWADVMCSACRQAADDREAEELRAAAEERDRLGRLAVLAAPPLYAEARLDTFDTPSVALGRVLTLARAYCSEWPDRARADAFFPQVVVLRGGTGTGKGHIAWAIAREVALTYRGRPVVAKLGDIVRDLRESWGAARREPGVESEAARLRHYRKPDLLVIDEVSRHALANRDLAAILYDVVDHRQEHLRPTILTTNEPDNTLAELLGPALVSRVKAWSGIWDFGSVDYRATVLAARRRAAKGGR